jgi:hypothetical protein
VRTNRAQDFDPSQWPCLSGTTPAAILLSLLERRLAEPLVEPDAAESRLARRNQRSFAEFGPEVPRVRVDDMVDVPSMRVVCCRLSTADRASI